MKIKQYLYEKRASDGALLFVLIDPLDYDSPEQAVKSAISADKAGVDMLLVGGSTGAQGILLEKVVEAIKKSANAPVTLFPGNIATISCHADAVYFMSMLNSRNPYWITGAQTLAAPMLQHLDVEPLSTGYIVIGRGETVGWVGDANGIPLNKPKIAAAMALAGKYLGFDFILLDAGSAAPEPVPPLMIKATKSLIKDTFLITAGGIKTDEQIKNAIAAGADAIQIGTIVEQSEDVGKRISEIVRIVKEEGRKRIKTCK